MDTVRFWTLIDLIDREALDAGDEDEAIAPLSDALTELTEREIESFQEHLSQVLYDIDGEDYARESEDSGDSDDGFLYCRCYVVARGRQHYLSVKDNPEAMPKSVDQWCESLLYAAPKAWAEKTSNEPEDWEFSPSVSYETGSNTDLWP